MPSFQTWPAELGTAVLMFHVAPNLRMGPMLRSGRQQVVEESSGYWIAETNYDLISENDTRIYAAMIAKAAGGARGFILPCGRSYLQAPWPGGSPPASQPTVSFDDARSFDTTILSRSIDVRFVAGLQAGSTEIEVWAQSAGTIRQGIDFSYLDAYSAKRMATIIEPPVRTGSYKGRPTYRLAFTPSLRTDVSTKGDAGLLDFEDTGCVMRLAEPLTGKMAIKSYYVAEPEITWTEWWPDE